jgi:hypothetical protein
MITKKKRKIEAYLMDLREKRHSKHWILQNQDLIIKKMIIKKKRKIESYLTDLREKQHSIRVKQHYLDLNRKDKLYRKTISINYYN